MKFNRLLWILGVGFILRLAIAYFFYGSGDIEDWQLVSDYAFIGKSPYHYGEDGSARWNYTPIWFWLITAMSWIHHQTGLSFVFTVKWPLIAADLGMAWILWRLGALLCFSDRRRVWTTGLFFLNPVSILNSAYHGQFDCISLLFAMAAVLVYYLEPWKRRYGDLLFLSLAVAVKHFNIVLAPVFAFRRKGLWAPLFCLVATPALFILLLLPHLVNHERAYVLGGILSYNLHAGYWGWSGILCRLALFFADTDLKAMPWFHGLDYFNLLVYAAIFIVMILLRQRVRPERAIVITFLMFYAFSTQMAPQYSVWIIPFAAIEAGVFYYLYSAVTTLQLGAFYYCHRFWFRHLPIEGFIPNLMPEAFVIFRHLTWLVTVLWLVHELRRSFKKT